LHQYAPTRSVICPKHHNPVLPDRVTGAYALLQRDAGVGFFKQGCDDHVENAILGTCCKKIETRACTPEEGNCCDDKVTVVSQEITSLMPHWDSWPDVNIEIKTTALLMPVESKVASPVSALFLGSDSGPPIYVLHHALIYYA
jgi:hypothetical protein